MNLLQLHLSDFCRFALALPSFPELSRTGLLDGQYTVDDVHEIVAYAHDRGIRVVPEVDLPGHASALLPLKERGLRFCEPWKGGETLPEEAAKVYDDPQGSSRKVLRQLLQEVASAFGQEERWFHVGGDEVSPSAPCGQDNVVGLEEFVTRDIVNDVLGRTAVGWGEVLLKRRAQDGERAAGDTNTSIFVAWQGPDQVREVLRRGHRVVAAAIGHHYLDTDSRERPGSSFWYDLASTYGDAYGDDDFDNEDSPAPPASPPKGLLGGISAMWTDRYCYAYQCGAAGEAIARRVGSHSLPAAPAMFLREFDQTFARSFGGMVWPRAGIAAAALWHYSPDLAPSQVSERSDWLAELLSRIGRVSSCPPGCECDELSACGRPYAVAPGQRQQAESAAASASTAAAASPAVSSSS